MMPNTTATSHPTGPKRRRTHRKSRNGCSECKARHIKCDEGLPRCANCVSTLRYCSLEQSPSSRPASATIRIDSTRFAAVHLICLHHAETHMEKYMALHGSARPILNLAMDHAATAPFLLDQVLALAALHLSAQDTTKNAYYHQQATELQTRALQLFNQAREASRNDKELESDSAQFDSIPAFVFASLLGIHVLQETLSRASYHHDLAAFVEAFIQYVGLHRGVRTVMANGLWPVILQSDLKPLLYLSTLSQDVDQQTPGEETLQLKEFLSQYNAGQDSINACQDALERIQWMIDLCNKHPSREDVGIHATMAWPLLVSQEYYEALHQHRPEAFAVLAFYAASLQRYRKFWVFGESGSWLLPAILNTIGSFWRENLGPSFQTMLRA